MILVVCANPSVDTVIELDYFKEGTVNRSKGERHFAGGKGIHVAMAAKELGEEVTLLGIWGGPTGQWLQDSCKRLGIFCIGPSTEGWNRSCCTFKSDFSLKDTELLGVGPIITIDTVNQFLAYYSSALQTSHVVCISGSMPPGMPLNTYAVMVEIANKYGKPCIVDCTGKSLAEAIKVGPYGIHLNENEANYICPNSSIYENIKTLTNQNIVIAITYGAKGLVLSKSNTGIKAMVQLQKVYSTVGSGDCLTAGLACAYIWGYSLEETARYATACGSANCLREDLGMLYKSDVIKLLPQVQIQKIKI